MYGAKSPKSMRAVPGHTDADADADADAASAPASPLRKRKVAQ